MSKKWLAKGRLKPRHNNPIEVMILSGSIYQPTIVTRGDQLLEIRPNCELCDKDLPPASADARICSYECTYCSDCVTRVLRNVCPTCGGGFVPRPIRPKGAFRPDLKLGLGNHPGSTKRRYSKFTTADIEAHVARIKDIAPDKR